MRVSAISTSNANSLRTLYSQLSFKAILRDVSSQIDDPYRTMDLINSVYRWRSLLPGPCKLGSTRTRSAETPSTFGDIRLKWSTKLEDPPRMFPGFFRSSFTLILSPCTNSQLREGLSILRTTCIQMASAFSAAISRTNFVSPW